MLHIVLAYSSALKSNIRNARKPFSFALCSIHQTPQLSGMQEKKVNVSIYMSYLFIYS